MAVKDEFWGIKVWSILSLVIAFVFALTIKVSPPSNYESIKVMNKIFGFLQCINALAIIVSLYKKYRG